MSQDQNGAISTYFGKCKNYTPIKEKPIEVVDQNIGQLHECAMFQFSKQKDKRGLWEDSVNKGEQHCFVCKNYKENKIAIEKERYIFEVKLGSVDGKLFMGSVSYREIDDNGNTGSTNGCSGKFDSMEDLINTMKGVMPKELKF